MTKALNDAAKALKNRPRFEIRLSAFINQRLKLIETAMNAIFCSQALKVGLNQLSEERQIFFWCTMIVTTLAGQRIQK